MSVTLRSVELTYELAGRLGIPQPKPVAPPGKLAALIGSVASWVLWGVIALSLIVTIAAGGAYVVGRLGLRDFGISGTRLLAGALGGLTVALSAGAIITALGG